MPTYEYRCETCGELTEAMQRIADPPLTECPTCGGTLRKQFSAPAFQFKGSGWYATDYARKAGGAKEAGGAEGDGKAAKGGDGEGKAAKGGDGEGEAGGKAEKGSDAAASGGSGGGSKPAKAAGGATD